MPDVRNCRRCGRVYNYMGGAPLCNACKERDEADFKRIKEYLYQNPGATLSEVSTVLDVSVEKIKNFLKDGRLEILNSEGNLILECEKCGKAITTGRYCDECARGLTNNLKNAANQIRSSQSPAANERNKAVGLRYLNKDDSKNDFSK